MPFVSPTLPPENLSNFMSPEIDELLTPAIKERNFTQIGLILTESDHLPGLENSISSIRPRTHEEAAELFHSPAALSIWMTWNYAASLPWLYVQIESTKQVSWETVPRPAAKKLGTILWIYQELLIYSFGFDSVKTVPDEFRHQMERIRGWQGQQAFAPWMPMLMIRAANEYQRLTETIWYDDLIKLRRRDMKEVRRLGSRCHRIQKMAPRFYADEIRDKFDLSEVQLTFKDSENKE